MDVEAAAGRRVQHPLGQDQAIGSDHHGVGPRLANLGFGCGGVFRVFSVQSQAARLCHRHAVGHRILLDGRGLEFHATAGGPVGLAQHQNDLETRAVQALQGHAGEFGRTRKNELHGRKGGCKGQADGPALNRGPRPAAPWPAWS